LRDVKERNILKQTMCDESVLLVRAREIDFDGGMSTLRKVMKDMGFGYTRVDGRRYLFEQPTIAAKRSSFLRQYMDLCSTGKYDFVWLDETWIFQKGSKKTRSWQDVDVKSCPTRSADTGNRYIVLHAGGQNGWVDGMSILFKSGSKDGDYHGEMNSKNFMSWWRRLLRKLERPTVIIMDNAPYHSIKVG